MFDNSHLLREFFNNNACKANSFNYNSLKVS